MIAIIDYGLGNVKAFVNVFRKLNIPVVIAKTPSDFDEADKIILPGVGAFDYAMTLLINSGMRETLDKMVLEMEIPVLGVCVGMQMLGSSSEEGKLPGLGWIDGKVKRFILPEGNTSMRIPHMGWNNIRPLMTERILHGLDNSLTRFYFLHSYYFECTNSINSIADTDYNGKFTSAIRHNNVYGVQFHPEKSHSWGLKLLENFAKL